ncbi:H-NS histone family protein [Spiribacter halobius]|uniref:H-NS histone family protein n=1 Tax=Sediminicurvatus halobius TaxID=2182432 RepID=UPI001E5DF17F|nr:H-NS histone family protein [Spiribacter halobius]UEX76634.1 H-NS histone family protein [Spiribacter halobius]
MTQSNVDLSKYNIEELATLKKDIDKEIQGRRKQDQKKALREAKKVAERYGFSLTDLVGAPAKAGKSSGKGTVRFRHPEDPSKTWSGRGRKPGWVKDWEAKGRDLDELRAA